MTDPPPRRNPLLASTSSKIAAGLFATIVLASISMAIATAHKSANPSPRTTAAAASPTGTRAMPPPANPPRASVAPGEAVQVAFQVTSLKHGRLITGRILQPLTPTTLTRTHQTVTVELTPGATPQMGTSADIKPGALLQASGTADNNRTLHAKSIVVLTGYVHLQPGEAR